MRSVRRGEEQPLPYTHTHSGARCAALRLCVTAPFSKWNKLRWGISSVPARRQQAARGTRFGASVGGWMGGEGRERGAEPRPGPPRGERRAASRIARGNCSIGRRGATAAPCLKSRFSPKTGEIKAWLILSSARRGEWIFRPRFYFVLRC